MNTYDSKNGIAHKCPCCGYEVEWDWSSNDFIKGDQSFIKIENSTNKTTSFDTDKPRYVSWGLPDTEKVTLLGCPKCGVVSFKIN